MKRFVDIRNQGTCHRFAFWDTVRDRFEEHDGCMAWDSFEEFELCYEGSELERYRALCPDWVHDGGEDDIEAFYAG